jgi:uncharacterized protein (DUF1330 family)
MQRPFLLISAAVIFCVGIAAALVQGVHAQAKPAAYVVFEFTPANNDAYAKEYVPAAQKSVRDHGGKFLRGGGALPGGLGNNLSIAGDPAKSVVLFRFESLDKAQEWSRSAAWRDALLLGQKYTSYFRVYAVEGLLQ